MKMTLFAALALVAVACGAEEVAGPGTTHVDRPATTTAITLPGATQQELLAEARLVWATNRPDSYELTYVLDCECDSGPWYVQVEGNETVLAGRVVPEPGAVAPYQSVEAIFTAIEIALADTEFPVDVEYDENLGYPRSYIYNEPGLAYDAGFVLEVTGFEANPSPGDAEQREAFANALRRWETAGIVDYEYQFTRNCFCPREFTGPYAASVQNGEVTLATLDGVDLFDIEMLEIGRYDEIIQSVDDVFAEVERAVVGIGGVQDRRHVSPAERPVARVAVDHCSPSAEGFVYQGIQLLGPAHAGRKQRVLGDGVDQVACGPRVVGPIRPTSWPTLRRRRECSVRRCRACRPRASGACGGGRRLPACARTRAARASSRCGSRRSRRSPPCSPT